MMPHAHTHMNLHDTRTHSFTCSCTDLFAVDDRHCFSPSVVQPLYRYGCKRTKVPMGRVIAAVRDLSDVGNHNHCGTNVWGRSIQCHRHYNDYLHIAVVRDVNSEDIDEMLYKVSVRKDRKDDDVEAEL